MFIRPSCVLHVFVRCVRMSHSLLPLPEVLPALLASSTRPFVAAALDQEPRPCLLTSSLIFSGAASSRISVSGSTTNSFSGNKDADRESSSRCKWENHSVCSRMCQRVQNLHEPEKQGQPEEIGVHAAHQAALNLLNRGCCAHHREAREGGRQISHRGLRRPGWAGKTQISRGRKAGKESGKGNV